MTYLTAGFTTMRPLMFAIAYRMTGSVAEAEDITQDAFLRMLREETTPANPDAYATTVTTRLAIDHLRSARVRREQYVGEWLPEPRLSAIDNDPAVLVDRNETLSTAFLLVLERLSASERAAFVLREAFGYAYDRIGEIVGKSADNCRQLVARARAHIGDAKPRFEASPRRRDELAERFFAACQDGDLSGLEQLLAEDVIFHGDGGGKAQAIAKPLGGRTQVARLLLGLLRRAQKEGTRLEPVTVNGQPGALAIDADGRTVAVLALQIADGMIHSLYNVINPDKLQHLNVAG